MKRIRIAHVNQQDYKREIQKFLMMYNVTPHGTTGKSPSELMFNRNNRDKIPSIVDMYYENSDSETRDRDYTNKQKGKEKADLQRGAKDPNINVGDKVFLKNVILPNKLTPTFDKNEYEVISKNGNDVVVSNGEISVRRNISHLKKLPLNPKETVITTNSSTDHQEHAELNNLSSPSAEINSTEPIPPLRLQNTGGMWSE